MLQISTGKFFRPVKLYTTHHRGVLYTNYHTREEIETVAGALRPVERGGDMASLLYEVDERLEAFAPAREAVPGAVPGMEVRSGKIVEQILAAVDATGADVLVIGYHRRGLPGVIEAGSTARHLSHAAPCAVLTIPL